jgi:formylglycine-generating enzyme required for sulfatase activity
VPTSCEGGLATCGADGTADCCASVEVPGGDFDRGNNDAYPATLGAFRLDLYEVTVARFRKFEADFATGWRPMVGDGDNLNTMVDDGWEDDFTAELPANRAALRDELACHEDATWTNPPGAHETRPINCVGWYVAFAFCIWDGGWLPTEAEWNFAAAGGDEQRIYPWSDSPDIGIDNASYNVGGQPETCGGDYDVSSCTVDDFIRPGSRPDGDGLWGHADLSGNVLEWVRDRAGPYPDECENCVTLSGADNRVALGGCYINDAFLLRTDQRFDFPPHPEFLGTGTGAGIGIRCARALKPVATPPRRARAAAGDR